MIYPDKLKFMKDSKSFKLVPVYREVRADFETPVSIFLKVKGKMLLESIEQGENVGRFSIIGLGKRVKITLLGQQINIKEYNGENGDPTSDESFELTNPLEKVREYFNRFTTPDYEGLPPFYGGALGYLGYETLQYFERVPDIAERSANDVPDGLMIVPEVVLVYDSVRRTIFVTALTTPDIDGETHYNHAIQRIDEISEMLAQPLDFEERKPDPAGCEQEIEYRMEKSRYMESVETCKQHIVKGDIIQAVLSQQFAINTTSPPFELYRTLRVMNPSPYLFYLDLDEFSLIGSSPEVMVRVQDGELLLKPIAGTRKRGKTVAEDDEAAKELLADPKELAEHLMLVDLGRNDLGRVAEPGSVRVTDYMKIEKFSHVMHIVSTIKAQLDQDYDVFDVIQGCFPAGTLTGAPKVRAMEIIADLENTRRGPYGGMIFNLGFNGNLDSCITIRTILLKDGVAVIQAGAGIVADSVPENEYKETVSKAQALMDAIKQTDCQVGSQNIEGGAL